MTLHRFYVPPSTLRGRTVELDGAPYEQMRRVLRMREGDEVALFDGGGYEYRVRLISFGKGYVRGEVVEKRPVATEPEHEVVLYLSLLNKPEKFEWALQKCTELGVTHFVPVAAARSVTQAGRGERWQRILQEAAEQSGRGIVPILAEPVPIRAALAEVAQVGTLGLMPEVGSEISLKNAIEEGEGSAGRVALFIGPEGGFTAEEQQEARECGVRVVSLGPRVLRAETAAVVAVTLALSALGEI